MFERFTDRARRVVVLAQEETRIANRGAIGCEHILLGLLHEGESIAAEVLLAHDITLDHLRDAANEFGVDGPPPQGHIPFAPECKKALEYSLRDALQLGHNYIAPEHLLLALMRDNEGIPVQILAKFSIEPQHVRDAVIKKLIGYSREPKKQYLRSPDASDPAYVDASLAGVAALIDHGWTLVSRVVGPVVCPDCHVTHNCDRYVEATP